MRRLSALSFASQENILHGRQFVKQFGPFTVDMDPVFWCFVTNYGKNREDNPEN
ncbi:hypothetical protein I79_015978 [Cricetulus griseus]|uniref:Uncharacterized protein n=1 Tax=Cricetulus griseus TaxID=10029 RepID=G3HY60_CRIGR|nr:hypothetical protein I79_015978 [Cricetulus griseus]